MRCRQNWRWIIALPTIGKSLFSGIVLSRTEFSRGQLPAFGKWDKLFAGSFWAPWTMLGKFVLPAPLVVALFEDSLALAAGE